MANKKMVSIQNFLFFENKFSNAFQKIFTCGNTNCFGTLWLFFLKSMVVYLSVSRFSEKLIDK